MVKGSETKEPAYLHRSSAPPPLSTLADASMKPRRWPAHYHLPPLLQPRPASWLPRRGSSGPLTHSPPTRAHHTLPGLLLLGAG